MIDFFRTTFLLLCIFTLSLGVKSCGSSQTANTKFMFEENPPFTVEDAYFQKWMAGTKEGGAGIKVHILFETIDPEVVVKNIYFRNQIQKAQNALDNRNEYFAELSNTSRNDVVMDLDPMKEVQNTISKNFPFELKENEAVVSYWFRGEKTYFKIPNLSEKEHIAYPQSNPNIRN